VLAIIFVVQSSEDYSYILDNMIHDHCITKHISTALHLMLENGYWHSQKKQFSGNP
jgi:hypothetical protein